MAEALPADTVRDSVLPTVIELSSDPIPNIRFNVAKSLETMIPMLKQNQAMLDMVSSMAKPTLEKLSSDPDVDVRFFANRALETSKCHDKYELCIMLIFFIVYSLNHSCLFLERELREEKVDIIHVQYK